MSDAALDAEALVERRGSAGVIVLNRPKALNALTLTMVRLIAVALSDWERDPAVTRVVVRGAGEKAFCAGGDIRHLYDLGRAGDHASQLTFWREEYQLNERIRSYPKPVVALIDGIVMGGGVGVSINAAHRVAGERFGHVHRRPCHCRRWQRDGRDHDRWRGDQLQRSRSLHGPGRGLPDRGDNGGRDHSGRRRGRWRLRERWNP